LARSATPLGAASEALHTAMNGAFPDLAHLGIMAGWTLLLSLLAVRTFRWE
jgi:ABC-2 type transport system permease protein